MQTQAWLRSDYDRILILYAMEQFPSNTNKWNTECILLGIWDEPDQNLMAVKEHVILLSNNFFFLLNLNHLLANLYLELHKEGWGNFFFFLYKVPSKERLLYFSWNQVGLQIRYNRSSEKGVANVSIICLFDVQNPGMSRGQLSICEQEFESKQWLKSDACWL